MRTPIYFWLLICVIAVTINHTNAEEDFNPLNTIENQYESKHSSGNVNLFWTLNEDGGSLSIAITAPATGWLGIAFSLVSSYFVGCTFDPQTHCSVVLFSTSLEECAAPMA